MGFRVIPALLSLAMLSTSAVCCEAQQAASSALDNPSSMLARQHLKQAHALFEQKKLAECLAEASTALGFEPNNAEAKAFLVQVRSAILAQPRQMADPNDQPSVVSPESTRTAHRDSTITLRKDTAVLFRLKAKVGSKAGDQRMPALEVAQDVSVDGRLIVAKGVAPTTAIERQPAGNRLEPGWVDLTLQSVRSVTGREVFLVGSEFESAEKDDPLWGDCSFAIPLCVMLTYGVKGRDTRLRSDTLVAGYVKDDLAFDRNSLDSAQPPGKASQHVSGGARIHLFYNDVILPQSVAPNAAGAKSLAQYRVGIHLDDASLGSLHPWEYACAFISEGTHTIRAGKDMLSLSVATGQEYFVRIQMQAGVVSLMAAPGYEIATHSLVPGKLKKRAEASCF